MFHMSIQIIAMSDLGKDLMTLGFEARTTLLKMWVNGKILFIMLKEIGTLVSLIKYKIFKILR